MTDISIRLEKRLVIAPGTMAALLLLGCGDTGSGEPGGETREPDAAIADPDAAGADPDAGPGEDAELVVVDADAAPAEALVGQEIMVTATVQNIGTADGSTVLELAIDDEVEATKFVAVDAPADGETPQDTEVEAAFFFFADDAGDYALAVDGVSAGIVTVAEPSPDLVVVGADAQPLTVEDGDEVTVTATVQNRGDADGAKLLELEVDGAVNDSKTVTVEAPADGQSPEDTELEAEFAFSTNDPGDYALAVNGVSAGTVTVEESDAVPGYQRITERFNIAAGQSRRITVECPDDGSVVFSGGVRVVTSTSGRPPTHLEFSTPGRSGSREFWRVGLVNTGDVDLELEGRAVCAQPLDGHQQVQRERTLSAGEDSPLSAPCPDDLVIIGGGVETLPTRGDPSTRLLQTMPLNQNRWAVRMRNVHSFEDRTIRVRAICAHPPRGYEERQTFQTIEPGEFITTLTRCSSFDKIALTGGFRDRTGIADFHTRIHVDFPEQSSAGGRIHQWRTGISNEAFDSRDLASSVICSDP